MTGAEFGAMVLRLVDQEFPPRDADVVRRVLARAAEKFDDELREEARVDAKLRAGALARLPTEDLQAELAQRLGRRALA